MQHHESVEKEGFSSILAISCRLPLLLAGLDYKAGLPVDFDNQYSLESSSGRRTSYDVDNVFVDNATGSCGSCCGSKSRVGGGQDEHFLSS